MTRILKCGGILAHLEDRQNQSQIRNQKMAGLRHRGFVVKSRRWIIGIHCILLAASLAYLWRTNEEVASTIQRTFQFSKSLTTFKSSYISCSSASESLASQSSSHNLARTETKVNLTIKGRYIWKMGENTHKRADSETVHGTWPTGHTPAHENRSDCHHFHQTHGKVYKVGDYKVSNTHWFLWITHWSTNFFGKQPHSAAFQRSFESLQTDRSLIVAKTFSNSITSSTDTKKGKCRTS